MPIWNVTGWRTPSSGSPNTTTLNDGLYETHVIPSFTGGIPGGKKVTYDTFTMGVPVGRTIVGIEVEVAMLASHADVAWWVQFRGGGPNPTFITANRNTDNDVPADDDGLGPPALTDVPVGVPPTFPLLGNGGEFDLWDDFAPGQLTAAYVPYDLSTVTAVNNNAIWKLVLSFRNYSGYIATVWVDQVRVRIYYRLDGTDTEELNGVGTMTVTLSKGKVINVAMAGASAATLSAAPLAAIRPIVANFSGVGAADPIITRDVGGIDYVMMTRAFSGVGTLGAQLRNMRDGSHTFSGTGTLSATPIRRGVIPAAFSATGVLTHALARKRIVTSALSGVGTLTPTLQRVRPGSPALVGVGTLAVTLKRIGQVTAPLAGVGTLGASIRRILVASETIAGAGSGTLGVTLLRTGRIAVAFAGAGTLTPELASNLTLPATCDYLVPADDNTYVVPADDNSLVVPSC